jgi:hypothetical protein
MQMDKTLSEQLKETKLNAIVAASEKMLAKQFELKENAAITTTDKTEATDIINLLIKCSTDNEYCVDGLQNMDANMSMLSLSVQYSSEKEPTYLVTLYGVRSISMRTLSVLINHGSVSDITIEPCMLLDKYQNINVCSLSVTIILYKSVVNTKTINVWRQENRLSPDENTTGLIMDEKSKVTAKTIIQLVTNMAFKDWEPVWSNRVQKDCYMLEAAHVRRLSYSFYTYLKNIVGDKILNNCIILSEMVESHASMTLMFHCNYGICDTFDQDAAASQEAEASTSERGTERVAKAARNKKHDKLRGVSNVNGIKKNKSNQHSDGFVSKVTSWLGF